MRKLRLVIADECGRRRTYDFDVEFPKLYSDPHVKSMYIISIYIATST